MQETTIAKLAEAEKLIGAPLTTKEREKFQYHTVDAIVGIKLIEALTSDELKDALRDKAKMEALRLRVGADTNPTWVVGRLAEALYDRGEIDGKQLDAISEYGGLEIPL